MEMKLCEFCSVMERIAPRSLALAFDNVGLLIEPDHETVTKVLVALDLSDRVAEEAVQGGYDLVLTHHPIFLDAVKSFSLRASETSAAYRLIRHGIGHFAAHTNLDACDGGVNDVLADLLGLTNVRPLPPENLGRIGMIQEPLSLSAFAALCESVLHTKGRVVGRADAIVHRVAVIGGAGGGDVEFVRESGCDTFVTGEMKHHQALSAEHYGISCCVLGHYETEFPVLKPLISRLQNEGNDVQYDLTHSGGAPLRSL
jgi:dinuclear metal center YbgI/SA1388 family protein